MIFKSIMTLPPSSWAWSQSLCPPLPMPGPLRLGCGVEQAGLSVLGHQTQSEKWLSLWSLHGCLFWLSASCNLPLWGPGLVPGLVLVTWLCLVPLTRQTVWGAFVEVTTSGIALGAMFYMLGVVRGPGWISGINSMAIAERKSPEKRADCSEPWRPLRGQVA